ncbi:hypothetical protein ACJMK2_024702 [Sinanodonta woodiana]|uniref:Chitin-binding type-4 domain-containing protein n=1 Tax=Sinanodonta woodiana TaxID=1069815 RepID=A0ABD3XE63_SINWO
MMWKMCTRYRCIMLISLGFLDSTIGHGVLIDPPARNYMGEAGFDVPVNYNGNSLNCGGMMNHWQKNGGKCGLCGDPYQGPRDHEAGGIYATGTVGKCYPVDTGQISVTIKLTAYHGGYFEFRLCAHDDPQRNITQSCLDRHVLTISGTGSIKHDINSILLEYYVINIDLPDGITCTFCVLQWKYHAENSWGCDESGCGIGRGHQEQFYNCADIAILPSCLKANDTILRQADSAQRVNTLQSGTYLEKTDRSQLGRTICNGVGVWELVASMAEWCTQNCLGPTTYCPDSLCACKQVEDNSTKSNQELKPKNATADNEPNKIIREDEIQGDQTHTENRLRIPIADQAHRAQEAKPEFNNGRPDYRRKGRRVTHFLYLLDPVASGLVKGTSPGLYGSLLSPSFDNNDNKGRFFQDHWKSYGGHCWLSNSHEEEDHIDNLSNVTILSGKCHPAESRQFEVEVRIKEFSGDIGWKCSEGDCETRMRSKTASGNHDEFTKCLHRDCTQKAVFTKPKRGIVSGLNDDSKPVDMREMSDSSIVHSRHTEGTVSSTNSKCIPEHSVELNVFQPQQDSEKIAISETLWRPSKEAYHSIQDAEKRESVDAQVLRTPHSSTSYKMAHAAQFETTDPILAGSISNERHNGGHVCYGVRDWAGTKDMDDWCMYSCFHSDPYCPEEYCACSIADPIIMGRNMEKVGTCFCFGILSDFILREKRG